MAVSKSADWEILTTCSICFTKEADPKRLECDHTFCVNCLCGIFERRKEDMSAEVYQYGIQCPECRHLTEIPQGKVQDLPTNLLMKQLREMTASVPRPTDNQRDMCQLCTNIKAEKYCKECKIDICEKCESVHKEKIHFKHHHIIARNLIFCTLHEKQYSFFCEDCNMLSCMTCVDSQGCENHSVILLRELEDGALRDCDELIDKITEAIASKRSKRIPRYAANNGDRLAELRSVKKAISEQCDRLIGIINVNRRALIMEISEKEQTIISFDKSVKKEKKTNLLEELLALVIEAKENGIEHMFITLPIIKARLGRVLCPVPEQIQSRVSFVPEDSLDVGSVRVISDQDCAENAKPIVNTLVPILQMQLKELEMAEAKQEPIIKWQVEGFKSGTNVLFTPSKSVAVCDKHDVCVTMYGPDGMKTAINVDNAHPMLSSNIRGIVHDPYESSLLLTDSESGLVFFDDVNLIFSKHLRLDSNINCRSVAVMSSGNFVITTFDHKICICDRQGETIKAIDEYGYLVHLPSHVTVLPDDKFAVSVRGNKHVVFFSSSGICTSVVDVSRYGWPRGLCHHRGHVLVCCGPQDGRCYLVRLTPDVSGLTNEEVVMAFSAEQTLQDVDAHDTNMALLFDHSLKLYQLP